MSNIIHKKLYLIITWAAVFAWLMLIFYMSAMPAEQSNNLSRGITEIMVETAKKVSPNADVEITSLNHYVRKNAHFFSYLVLGILVMNALRRSKVYGLQKFFLTLAICVLYAISDEIHQIFVPGRGYQVSDILIDSAGAIVGIVIYKMLSIIIRRKSKILY